VPGFVRVGRHKTPSKTGGPGGGVILRVLEKLLLQKRIMGGMRAAGMGGTVASWGARTVVLIAFENRRVVIGGGLS